MRKSKTKKNTKELSKIKKTKKKLLNPFSLQPLADAYQNFKKKQKKETADKINAADGMIFQTEKQLKEFGEKLSEDKKKPIEDALAELKKAHESKDLDAIDATMETINTAWSAASEEMYKASQEAGANPEGGEASENNTSDDVTDVEFEEVKDDDNK